MAKTNKTSDKLLKIIESLQVEGVYLAMSPEIARGGARLANYARNSPLASGDNNWKESFGRMPVLRAFCETFSPILMQLAPEGSVARDALNSERLLPMAPALGFLVDARNYALRLRSCADLIYGHFVLLADGERKRREISNLAEGLRFMSDILSALPKPKPKQAWCKSCFRRSTPGTKYCHLHYNSHFSNAQKSENRRARKSIQALPKQLKDRWARNRSLRLLPPDRVNLVSEIFDDFGLKPDVVDVFIQPEQLRTR